MNGDEWKLRELQKRSQYVTKMSDVDQQDWPKCPPGGVRCVMM